jgi:hypothetical protein
MIRVATRAMAADAIKRFYYSEVPVISNAKTIYIYILLHRNIRDRAYAQRLCVTSSRVRFLRAKFVTHITLPPPHRRRLMLLRGIIIFNNLLADVFYISRLFTEFIHRVLTPRGLKQVLFSFLLCRNTKQ